MLAMLKEVVYIKNVMPNVIIISGFGLNCEEETQFAFLAVSNRVKADIIHINELVSNPGLLKKYQILAIPGGFSYGDHTGAGNAFSCYLKNHLMEGLKRFREEDKLIIGICNGCQTLVRLFAEDLPAYIVKNNSGKYQCEWVEVEFSRDSPSIWCRNIKKMRIPIAHGEGKFVMKKEDVNVAIKYLNNPNGSEFNAAALTSSDGRVLAMMPHPERAIFFTQQDNWTFIKEQLMRNGKNIPKYGDGLKIFVNGVNYFE